MSSLNQFIIGDLPGTVPWPIYRGDNPETPLIIEEGDEGGPYEPVNITGSTFAMRIQQKRGNLEVLTLTTSNGGIVITDAANGEFKVVFSSAQTTALPTNCPMLYDLQWVNSSGDKKTLIAGEITVAKDVTTT